MLSPSYKRDTVLHVSVPTFTAPLHTVFTVFYFSGRLKFTEKLNGCNPVRAGELLFFFLQLDEQIVEATHCSTVPTHFGEIMPQIMNHYPQSKEDGVLKSDLILSTKCRNYPENGTSLISIFVLSINS